MYSPKLARFLSEDPLTLNPTILNDNNWFGDALTRMRNLYGYCDNDPVNWTDPSGLIRYQTPLPIAGACSPEGRTKTYDTTVPRTATATPETKTQPCLTAEVSFRDRNGCLVRFSWPGTQTCTRTLTHSWDAGARFFLVCRNGHWNIAQSFGGRHRTSGEWQCGPCEPQIPPHLGDHPVLIG
jgi:RHS repeat-associated protein